MWFSGIIKTRLTSGQTFSIAIEMACIVSGAKSGFKLLNPPGKRFVSTGVNLKTEFLRSTEA